MNWGCVELIFWLRQGWPCWSLRTQKIKRVIKGMAAKGQHALRSLGKVFLIGNPIRQSLRSSALQLCRKKVKPFFLSDRLAFRRVILSTFSLDRMPLMFWRSWSPIVIVWVFQHPSLRAALSRCLFLFLISSWCRNSGLVVGSTRFRDQRCDVFYLLSGT